MAPERWVVADGSQLVRDRKLDRPWPALPYMHTGSRLIERGDQPPSFMLDHTRSLAVNYDEPDALLGSPLPVAGYDARHEVNGALAPPAGSRIHIILRPATLAVRLDLQPDGLLSYDGQTLDDAALSRLLAAHYGPGQSPELRAVAVAVPRGLPRADDVVCRRRILQAAVAAQAWVVPVFVPRP
jgi:hypothetical protein